MQFCTELSVPAWMSVLEGSGIVNGQPVKKGDHFILPCGFGEVEMQGEMSLVVSTVPAQA